MKESYSGKQHTLVGYFRQKKNRTVIEIKAKRYSAVRWRCVDLIKGVKQKGLHLHLKEPAVFWGIIPDAYNLNPASQS